MKVYVVVLTDWVIAAYSTREKADAFVEEWRRTCGNDAPGVKELVVDAGPDRDVIPKAEG